MRGESKQYDNSNRGVLFKNDKKGHESRPDYRGEINISKGMFDACSRDGKLELSAWLKESKSGEKFMSLTVKETYKKDDAAPASKGTPPKSDAEDFDSDITF